MGLSRVTAIEGLYITDLCENKIAVNPDVKAEMQRLRTEALVQLSITPIYQIDQVALSIHFLNSRSLHRHIDDIRNDFNYLSIDVNNFIFSETRLTHFDTNTDYAISQYTLFRNDSQSSKPSTRPYGGTAVYSEIFFLPGYPFCSNSNGVEITIIKVVPIPHVTIIGLCRSPKVPVRQFCAALRELFTHALSDFKLFIGDFNINWLNEKEKRPLFNLFIRDHCFRQIATTYTTDNITTIDHIYTNLPESHVNLHILDTYF